MDTIVFHNQAIEKLEAELVICAKPFEHQLNLLQTIPGISQMAALGILAEIGTEMDKFHSDKHMASWEESALETTKVPARNCLPGLPRATIILKPI